MHPPLAGREYFGFPEPDDEISVIQQAGDYRFASLVNAPLRLLAELEIVLLRPSPPGNLIRQDGDIDNQLKTLFDALRVPTADEIPPDDPPAEGEDPFHCLLDDDARITKLTVTAPRYLAPEDEQTVDAWIRVQTRAAEGVTWANLALA